MKIILPTLADWSVCPTVVAAAVVGGDGFLYYLDPPNRHHDVIRMMMESKVLAFTQGFLMSNGGFASRKIAMDCVEVTMQRRITRRDDGHYTGRELFSEDLW